MGVALFTITNPIGTIPVFLDLTQTQNAKQQRRTALMTGLGVLSVLVISLLVGRFVLEVFDIDVTSFKIAGFAFVAMIAWGMMTKEGSPVASTGGSPAIVPLAFPVLAGPGAVALMITYAHDYPTMTDYLFGFLIIAVTAVATALLYTAAPLLMKALGKSGMSIFTKLFGLILLAICVQSIFVGLGTAFPALKG